MEDYGAYYNTISNYLEQQQTDIQQQTAELQEKAGLKQAEQQGGVMGLFKAKELIANKIKETIKKKGEEVLEKAKNKIKESVEDLKTRAQAKTDEFRQQFKQEEPSEPQIEELADNTTTGIQPTTIEEPEEEEPQPAEEEPAPEGPIIEELPDEEPAVVPEGMATQDIKTIKDLAEQPEDFIKDYHDAINYRLGFDRFKKNLDRQSETNPDEEFTLERQNIIRGLQGREPLEGEIDTETGARNTITGQRLFKFDEDEEAQPTEQALQVVKPEIEQAEESMGKELALTTAKETGETAGKELAIAGSEQVGELGAEVAGESVLASIPGLDLLTPFVMLGSALSALFGHKKHELQTPQFNPSYQFL
jgi:hypothetical protein